MPKIKTSKRYKKKNVISFIWKSKYYISKIIGTQFINLETNIIFKIRNYFSIVLKKPNTLRYLINIIKC